MPYRTRGVYRGAQRRPVRPFLSYTGRTVPLPDEAPGVLVNFGLGFQDLSSRVQTMTMRRGRQTSLDVIEAGTGSVGMVNEDGNLDPSSSTSPWAGLIVPLLPVKITRRLSNTVYPMFTGAIERWNPEWAPPFTQFMGIDLTDSFDAFANFVLTSDQSTLTTTLTGSNNDLTFTAVNAGEDGDSITVTYVVAGTGTTLAPTINRPFAGNASFSAVISRGQFGIFGAGSTIAAPAVGQAQPVTVPVAVSGSDITINIATDGSGNPTSTANDVMASMNGNPDIAALVTTTLAPGNTGTGVVTAMTQTSLTGGKWPAETTGERINRVLDLVGWPTDLRAIDPGTVTVISRGFSVKDNSSALSHLQEVADSELGYIFMSSQNVITFHDANHRSTATRSTTSQATFSDDGTGYSFVAITPAFDKDRIVNQATVTGGQQTSIAQTVNDTYSQTGTGTAPTGASNVPPGGFRTRSIARSTQLENDSDALSQATAIVDTFAYPKYRFDAISALEPQDPTAKTDWVKNVLQLEIGDLITVRTTPPATSTTTSYLAYVEEIQDDVSVGVPWKRTFRLSPQAASVTGGGGGGGTPGALLAADSNSLKLDDATDGVLG